MANPKETPGNTLISELHLVKWMAPDGVVHCEDLSGDNAGGEITEEERTDLIMWALGKQLVPYVISWIEHGKKQAAE